MSLKPRNAAARKPKPARNTCRWRLDDEVSRFKTECGCFLGVTWRLSDCLIPDNVRFCYSCGGRIVIQKKKV